MILLKLNNGNQINLYFSINSLLNPQTIVTSLPQLRNFQLETHSTKFSPIPDPYLKDISHTP